MDVYIFYITKGQRAKTFPLNHLA